MGKNDIPGKQKTMNLGKGQLTLHSSWASREDDKKKEDGHVARLQRALNTKPRQGLEGAFGFYSIGLGQCFQHLKQGNNRIWLLPRVQHAIIKINTFTGDSEEIGRNKQPDFSVLCLCELASCHRQRGQEEWCHGGRGMPRVQSRWPNCT